MNIRDNMKSSAKHLVVVILALFAIQLHAQTPEGLVAFNVYPPDDQITQGDHIHVSYVLDATNWSLDDFEKVPGIEMLQAKVSTLDIDGDVFRLEINCLFNVLASGPLALPRPNIVVDGIAIDAAPTVIDVQPNPKYGHEWTRAHDFLVALKQDPKYLEPLFSCETLVAFADVENHLFAVMAREAYETCLDTPILAFGIGSTFWDGGGNATDNSISYLIDSYDRQLRYLKQEDLKYKSPIFNSKEKKGIRPLLGDIKYGQFAPFNAWFPKDRFEDTDSTCLVGCGPVSLAQILTYYKSEVPPTGKGSLKTKSGKEYKINMKDYPFSWNGNESDIASLMMCAAASLNTSISPTASSSYLKDFPDALTNIWHYSAGCNYQQDCDDAQILSLIYPELRENRPVIIADEHHIFICDGFYKDFLHLNLGWAGHCNGFYRAIRITSDKSKQLPFTEILTGVQPDQQSQSTAAEDTGQKKSKKQKKSRK